MAKRAYTRRYAQAVFEIALENKELDRWQDDLKKIMAFTGDSAVMAALGDPRFTLEAKSRLISDRLADISTLAQNLLKVLITRGRVEIIGEIAAEYRRLLNRHRGIQQARVMTAVALDEELKQSLTEKLAAMVGSKITIDSRVDPAIIGGFVARIDGKLLDASTRSSLLALKKELTRAGAQ